MILDREFIDNFFISYDRENDTHTDFFEFLRLVINFELVINIPDFDTLEDAARENPLIRFLTQKVPKVVFEKNLNKKITDESFLKADAPVKLFLVENGFEDCEEKLSINGFEIFNNRVLIEKWGKYSKKLKPHKFKVTKSKSLPKDYKFDSWEKIKEFTHPIHSIVIFDRYILKNTSNQKIRDNLVPLLKSLLHASHDGQKIHVTIITVIKDKYGKPAFNLKNISSEIILELKKDIKADLQLDIIGYEKAFEPKDISGLKSRRIYTNYFIVKSDDSFNYFKPNGGINNRSDIEFEFLFDNFSFSSFTEDMYDLKNMLIR
ncbi:MAG: hypothetical protein U5Q03_00125 [Bacteroidota bacterium]|nr:hypothetical protein [Bacteroidota bacterium]